MQDSQLIWQLKRGNSAAIEKLYDKYETYLLTVAAGFMGNISEAEDVVQDFFVSFVKTAYKLKLKGSLKSYMAVCVANIARNKLKRRSFGSNNSEEDLSEIADYNTPEKMAIETENHFCLAEALSKLPLPQRDAVILHTLGDMKFREIAKLRDVSKNTVCSRYRYGLEKLRSILESEAVR